MNPKPVPLGRGWAHLEGSRGQRRASQGQGLSQGLTVLFAAFRVGVYRVA